MQSVLVLAPPKQLGKYEVGAKIGGGGMATVYIGRATLDDGTEERVALKVIRDELAHDEQFKSMFIDEAKILARLSHPNVIHTLEYGVTGHHRFIAMIDVAKSFITNKENRLRSFSALEQQMRVNTYKRFGKIGRAHV